MLQMTTSVCSQPWDDTEQRLPKDMCLCYGSSGHRLLLPSIISWLRTRNYPRPQTMTTDVINEAPHSVGTTLIISSMKHSWDSQDRRVRTEKSCDLEKADAEILRRVVPPASVGCSRTTSNYIQCVCVKFKDQASQTPSAKGISERPFQCFWAGKTELSDQS